jgi:hypothetical protein
VTLFADEKSDGERAHNRDKNQPSLLHADGTLPILGIFSSLDM